MTNPQRGSDGGFPPIFGMSLDVGIGRNHRETARFFVNMLFHVLNVNICKYTMYVYIYNYIIYYI